MIDELWNLLDTLDDEPDDFGMPRFSQDRYYDTYPLSKDNIQGFDLKDSERKVCSIDGGNNTIFRSPSDSVHLLRIYFNLFKTKNRVDNFSPFTGFLLSRLEGEKIKVDLHPIKNDDLPFKSTRFEIDRDEVENGKTSNASHTIRKYLEWDALKYAVEEHLDEGDIVIRDGVLQISEEKEKKYAKRAYQTVEENKVNLVGLSKTSSLLTTKGYPLIAAVSSLARESDKNRWYYHPITENSNPDHKGDIHIVKYHPSSNYAFRTEFYRGQDTPVKDILGTLSAQACDPTFLGYPYCLVDADKKARVTDEEIEYLRNMGKDKMKKTVKDKINTLNAHDRLSEL